ncbi:MAG: class I SAM-dependent RNA methyltransferase [Gemmatimonadota bacterium]
MSAVTAEPHAAVAVRIEALAAGGEGMGHLEDGRVVFVPRTAPGDRAEIVLERVKKRWARGRLVRILEESPSRVPPPCRHFARCGGCALQHLPYPEQLLWKGIFIRDALSRIGGREETAPPAVVPSPRTLHYRSRLRFTLRRLRGGRVVAGFHDVERPSRVVDLSDCLLGEEPLVRVWSALRDAWGPGARRLPAGRRLGLTLRLEGEGAEGGGGVPPVPRVHLVVEGGAPGWEPESVLWESTGLASVWHRPGAAEAPRRVGGPVSRDFSQTSPPDSPPTGFEQANRAAGAALVSHVVTSALQATPGKVVDAYCGGGAYGLPLAAEGIRVVGIERDPEAAARARDAAPSGFALLEGPVEERLGRALPADVAILNPPREGLAREVVEVLLATPPDVILYVSCNPATLARDLHRLASGYRLDAVTGFDLFPQTAHVEAVARLLQEGGRR